jgi:hypothetical protein
MPFCTQQLPLQPVDRQLATDCFASFRYRGSDINWLIAVSGQEPLNLV